MGGGGEWCVWGRGVVCGGRGVVCGGRGGEWCVGGGSGVGGRGGEWCGGRGGEWCGGRGGEWCVGGGSGVGGRGVVWEEGSGVGGGEWCVGGEGVVWGEGRGVVCGGEGSGVWGGGEWCVLSLPSASFLDAVWLSAVCGGGIHVYLLSGAGLSACDHAVCSQHLQGMPSACFGPFCSIGPHCPVICSVRGGKGRGVWVREGEGSVGEGRGGECG